MKIKLLFVALVIFTVSANCQLDKKYWLLGGTGNFYTYKETYTDTRQPPIVGPATITGNVTEINLNTNIGYFIIDKLAIGLRPGISSIKSHGTNSASIGTKSMAFFIGPFARYYLLNKNRQFNILLDGSYQLGSYSTFAGNGVVKNTSVGTGVEIFFNSSIGVELLLSYLHSSRSINDAQAGFENERSGLNISIGFQIHLIKD
jgi:hypothetical protein